MDGPYHIVITETGIVVVYWPGAEWRELQDHFDGFVTSLGPCDGEDVIDLVHAEWPDLARLRGDALHAFLRENGARFQLSGQ
jgi:hypothetical protein